MITFHNVDQLLPGMKADIRNFRDAQCQNEEYKMMESFHDGTWEDSFPAGAAGPRGNHCNSTAKMTSITSPIQNTGVDAKKTDRFDDIV